MEQRRLRLGDTLDDYCPRERRVTNHAIVAMIEDDIKQTRCTTCDAEHAYKGAKVPRKRKKDAPSALYKEVLAGMPDADHSPVLAPRSAGAPPAAAEPEPEPEPEAEVVVATVMPTPPLDEPAMVVDIEPDPGVAALPESPVEEGPVHRPLIRATLPRPEGFVKEERRLPEFTIRQNNGRGGNGNPFRGGRPRNANGGHGSHGSQGNAANGNRAHGGPRFAGRPGQPGRGAAAGRGGQPTGFRGAQSRPGGGRNKRSR
jgi:hypothetical protein